MRLKGTPHSDYERLFATILDVFGVDYMTNVSFYDHLLDHYGVGRFSVDFVSRGIIFELDGMGHAGWRQKRIDRMRDEFLTMQGFQVVRIKNKELDDDLNAVASRVYRLLFDGE